MGAREVRLLLNARGCRIQTIRINQLLVVKVGTKSVNLGLVSGIQADRVSLRQSPPSGTKFHRNGELLSARSFAIWPQPGVELVLKTGGTPLLGLQAKPLDRRSARITITSLRSS
jgi:hypothetical protein